MIQFTKPRLIYSIKSQSGWSGFDVCLFKIQMRIRFIKIQQILMNIQSNSYQDKQAKCKGCKLFFGSEAFQGLCSSCFKKHQGSAKESIEKAKVQLVQAKSNLPSQQQIIKADEPLQKDKKRCNDCNKKVGDLGVQCKCGFVFCNKHRLPQDHKCNIDYLSLGAKALQKSLIKVCHGKIDKIE